MAFALTRENPNWRLFFLLSSSSFFASSSPHFFHLTSALMHRSIIRRTTLSELAGGAAGRSVVNPPPSSPFSFQTLPSNKPKAHHQNSHHFFLSLSLLSSRDLQGVLSNFRGLSCLPLVPRSPKLPLGQSSLSAKSRRLWLLHRLLGPPLTLETQDSM